MKALNLTSWVIVGILSTAIGFYPALYYLQGRSFGLLGGVEAWQLESALWNIGFYGHITFGGLALAVGWIQFNGYIRKKWLQWHRRIGKAYAYSVYLSGICGVSIGFFAQGGLVSSAGFVCLGVVWLTTTWFALAAIRNGRLARHEYFMIFSYAACFAAVTLRLWLAVLVPLFGDFLPAYRLVAWLCWLPNLLVAWVIVRARPHPDGA